MNQAAHRPWNCPAAADCALNKNPANEDTFGARIVEIGANKHRSLEPVPPRWDDNFMVACRGAAGVAGIVNLLDEDRLDRADAASGIGTTQSFGQDAQTLRTFTDNLGSNLIRHAGRRRVRASREAEGMDFGEGSLLGKREGLLEVLFGLARETHDDVGGKWPLQAGHHG